MKSNQDALQIDKERPVGWLERLMKKRFGFGMLFALNLWPLLGFVPQLESLVVNGLLLETYYQLAFLTVTNVVAFFFSVSILRLLNSRNSGGFGLQWLAGDGNAPWGARRILCVWIAAMVAPLVVVSFFGSEFAKSAIVHLGWSLVTIFASAISAIAGLWLIGWIKCQLIGSDKATANYFPFESRSVTGFKMLDNFSSWVEKKLIWLGIEKVDLQFLIYLVLLAMAHHQLVQRLEGKDYWLTSAPYMLVLLIWIVFMALAGFANILDRWRLPVLPAVVLVLAILLAFRGSTHPLNSVVDSSDNSFVARIAQVRTSENAFLDEEDRSIEQRQQLIAAKTAPLDQDAWNAIAKRMEIVKQHQNEKGNTLIVVTCPGGGIHAAAWAACVLDQLSTEYVEFKDSVCIISGVSGGSVGTLMFVGSRYEDALLGRKLLGAPGPTSEDVHRELKENSPALELAARSSLEAIAFGMTVDDLYGFVGIPGIGRGQRLEDSFSSRLGEDVQKLTMGNWGDRAMEGTVPIVIFNSTDAISGRRVLFDTIPTPLRASSVGLTARPLNYRELMETGQQNFDVKPATAARTSATFPYISPFTRPERASPLGENVAICDGGYVDNEGIVTAVNWVEFLLKRWAKENSTPRTFDRILLLRIEPSATVDQNQIPDSGGLFGWFRWLTGPVETMSKVRAASQLERGNLETDLAALYLKVAVPQSNELPKITSGLMKSPVADEKVQSKNIVEIPAFDRRTKRPSKIRENWEEMLKSYESESPDDSKRIGPPPFGAAMDNHTNDTSSEPPVVVQTIRFVDANQIIPLNWKLSNRQKQGYLLAWRLCSGSGTSLRQTLDQYFTRANN